MRGEVGTGIVGIIASLAGAQETVLSDYPSQNILANLTFNVNRNVPQDLIKEKSVSVQGHEWGVLTDDFSVKYAGHFTRILCADCLWMDGEHYGLAQSISHFLSSSSSSSSSATDTADGARAWVIAGFHTGRAKIVSFFDIAVQAGLAIEEIWERDSDGEEREWDREREDGERNRWMVVAVLQRGEGCEGKEERESERKRKEGIFAAAMMQKSNRHA